tara:strand:- start:141 stop:368 length:228 start_codon:yes stop_codon:yes gene_type:complete
MSQPKTSDTTTQKKCFHNYPYIDEDPRFFKQVDDDDATFDGSSTYMCIHCGHLYEVDMFTEAGRIFLHKLSQLPK